MGSGERGSDRLLPPLLSRMSREGFLADGEREEVPFSVRRSWRFPSRASGTVADRGLPGGVGAGKTLEAEDRRLGLIRKSGVSR